jgi:hypothetical protein
VDRDEDAGGEHRRQGGHDTKQGIDGAGGATDDDDIGMNSHDERKCITLAMAH